MNKKTVIECGLGLVALAGTYFLFKRFKNNLKKQIEEVQERESQELESIGVSTKKLNEEIEHDESGNLVKALAIGSMFNPEWDYDLIDPEKALETSLPLISISQEIFNVRGTEVTDLVFYFDIPDTSEKDWKKPKLSDYMNGIKQAAEKAWSQIIRFCQRPKCWLVGMIVVRYRDKDGLLTSERVELDDPTVYESLKEDTHRDGYGLGALYDGIRNETLPDEVNEKLTNWINKRWSNPLPEFELIEFQLVYRVAFNMQSREFATGINLITGLKTLKYFLERIEIKRGGLVEEDEVKHPLYQNVIFCAPSERDETKYDLCSYYFINSNNNIESDCFSY